MRRLAKVLLWLFAVLYGLALAVYLIGLLGLFGAESDPLAGVFLVPLGLPWNRLIDALPERAWPWLMALGPLPNLLILGLLARIAGRGP